jgi:uncharacterized protein
MNAATVPPGGGALPRARGLHELDEDECRRLLATRPVGRLAFLHGGRPAIVPLNFAIAEGEVVFCTGEGGRLDGIAAQPVAFEVDDVDVAYHQGWSVVVEGVAEPLWGPEELERAARLPLRAWAPGDRRHYFRISGARLTGRRIV